MLMGTPAYMAPEQFRGGSIDPRTDQFSFCAALYEGLHGEPPFAGTTIHELSANVVAGRVREARSSARVPGWLRKVVLRGLRVDRGERQHPWRRCSRRWVAIRPPHAPQVMARLRSWA